MKGNSLWQRVGYATDGLRAAVAQEASFRTQLVIAVVWLVVLALLRLDAGWWLFNLFCIALVLSAELFNTALEHLADRLHPGRDPAIKVAKDCAAGAVLMLALLAVIVGVTTLWVMVPRLGG